MTLVEWDDGYNLGVMEIDEHHRHLVALINKSYGAVRLNNTHAIDVIMDELALYATYHFGTEEALMREFGYPSINMHEEEHGQFYRQVEELQAKLKSGEGLYKIRIVVFLKDWLMNHVMTTDRDLAGYLVAKGVE
jgi:hemerythrin-like metal-binding protein